MSRAMKGIDAIHRIIIKLGGREVRHESQITFSHFWVMKAYFL